MRDRDSSPGTSEIAAPLAPRNVLSRAVCIGKQTESEPEQTDLGVGSKWAKAPRAGVIPARCQHVVIGTAGLFYNPAAKPILQRSKLEEGERGGQKSLMLHFFW